MLPPAGPIFEKWYFLEFLLSILANFLRLSSRGLAGVLPPAGQIFEKLHFLEYFVNLGEFFVPFKHGSSRGAASGGPEF